MIRKLHGMRYRGRGIGKEVRTVALLDFLLRQDDRAVYENDGKENLT
jgi:hypothetical protein